MRIIKVFTKYDEPFLQINVPVLGDIVATEKSKNTNILSSLVVPSHKELTPVLVEKGLNDVIFVTYEEKL